MHEKEIRPMHLAVLGSTESWYFKDLSRAAGDADRLTPLTFRQMISRIGTAGVQAASQGVSLSSVDAVLVRTMPPGSLEQVVFRMDVLGRMASQVPVVNSPRAIEVAVDKYLATAKLREAGLPVPETIVCQGWEEAIEAFAQLDADVVVKPLFGSEGRGLTRINDEALALRAFKMLEQLGAVIYLQRFIEHDGYDLRLLVIGQQVLGMRRANALDWRTNVSRGARCEPLEVTPELAEVAARAAGAVGAELAGVDLLPAPGGSHYVLEVNAVPGWRALAATLQIDVASLVLDHLERQVRR